MKIELSDIEIMYLQSALIDKINKSNKYQTIILGNLYNKLEGAYEEILNDTDNTRVVKIKWLKKLWLGYSW